MKKTPSRTYASQEGSALLIAALAIFLLVAVAGMGIDLGRQQLLRGRLQQSSDAAALAGALAPDGADPKATANRYFTLNYAVNSNKSYLGSTTTPAISTANGVKVSANGSLKNQFLNTLNNKSSKATGNTLVTGTMGGGAGKYDVLLVMDSSLSMNAQDVNSTDQESISRFSAMRNVSESLVKQLLGDGSDSRVGAVYYYWTAPQYMRLTTSASNLLSFMNAVTPGPQIGTDSSQGLDVAWGTLSKDFRSDAVHVVIILTDGENNDYGGDSLNDIFMTNPGGNPYASLFNLLSPVSEAYADTNTHETLMQQLGAQSAAASEATCSKFKAMNPKTLIYAVGYGPQGQTASDFLHACATSSDYVFFPQTQDDLLAVFSTLNTTVKSIRITQ